MSANQKSAKAAAGPARVVMVLGSYGPSLVGFRLPLIQQLTERGCTVIAAAPMSEVSKEDKATLAQLGVIMADAPIHRHSLSAGEAVRYMRGLRRLMRQHNVDALVSYTAKPVIFGGLAARSAGVRRILPMVTGLGTALTGTPANLKQKGVRHTIVALYKLALSRAHCAFFQNLDDPRDLAAAGGIDLARTRIRILPGSGVDLARFAHQPLPPCHEGVTFLMIARVLANKGVREYAAAARLVRAKYPHSRFLLVGPFDTGPSAISPEEAATWNDVTYCGATEDVRPALAGCHVYVLPSYREGTPRSVLEAMAVGRAIITTDAPGCRDTTKEGRNGFLVPVGEAEPLAEAMTRFIEQPELIERMAGASLAEAERKYDSRLTYNAVLEELGLPAARLTGTSEAELSPA